MWGLKWLSECLNKRLSRGSAVYVAMPAAGNLSRESTESKMNSVKVKCFSTGNQCLLASIEYPELSAVLPTSQSISFCPSFYWRALLDFRQQFSTCQIQLCMRCPFYFSYSKKSQQMKVPISENAFLKSNEEKLEHPQVRAIILQDKIFALNNILAELTRTSSSSLPTVSNQSLSLSSFTVFVDKILWLYLYGTIRFLCSAGSVTWLNWFERRPALRLLSKVSGAVSVG